MSDKPRCRSCKWSRVGTLSLYGEPIEQWFCDIPLPPSANNGDFSGPKNKMHADYWCVLHSLPSPKG